MNIRFDGRVAIVTGAGRGLGRQYALDLASRGARVIVNDAGGSASGEGCSPQTAEAVAAEIRSAGGIAISSSANVATAAGAADIVGAALSAFGTIDILINNAGISRDRSFADMSEEDFRAVLDVHVLGAFHCSKAVWPTLSAKRWGRIVMTTSASGLYGMETHANYTAAKAALVGLTHVLSLEGRPDRILVNAVSPMARTRMSEAFLTPEMKQRLHPAWVSALVLWYCAEECTLTDQIIHCGMGYYAKTAMVEAPGLLVDGDVATPEYIRDNFARISDMTGARAHASAAEYSRMIGALVSASPRPA
jgi:NAD(P)-dependent dehydrogenase (short-subunit alcohol dehydrogenase family)